MKPSDTAQRLQALTAELGTQAKAAAAMGMSAYSASIYLRLLTLPKDTVDKIDCGQLPINQKKKTVRYCADRDDRDRQLIQLIGRVSYVTLSQVMGFMVWSESHARNILATLSHRGLVKKSEEHALPVYFLTNKGYRSLKIGCRNMERTSSVIHKNLIRNDIELSIKTKTESAYFVAREDCISKGLFPSPIEHYLVYDGGAALVLIDDHGVASEKLLTSLTRLHNKSQSEKAMAFQQTYWMNEVDYMMVYATTDEQVELHRTYWTNLKKASIESTVADLGKTARKYRVPAKSIRLFIAHSEVLLNIGFASRFVQRIWDVR